MKIGQEARSRVFTGSMFLAPSLRVVPIRRRQYRFRSSCEASSNCPNRRTILLGATAWQSITAVPAANAVRTVTNSDGVNVEAFEFTVDMKAVALRGSIPSQQISEFKASLGPTARVTMQQLPSLQQMWKAIDSGGTAAHADVVTLGDAWLAPAIKAGKLQPIPNAEHYRWWKRLPTCWHPLLLRDHHGQLAEPNQGGQVWGAPYRWGCTMVAFRKDKLAFPISDWSDLLQPALKNRVAFIESPRELLGVAMKASSLVGGKLGYNFTSRDLHLAKVQEQDVRDAVEKLARQVRVFSTIDHLRAVNADDCWAVVGWSEELAKLAQRSPKFSLVAPKSGTALWADLWTIPVGAGGGSRGAGPSPLTPLWIDYSLQPSRALASRGLNSGSASPLLLPCTGGRSPNASIYAADDLATELDDVLMPPPAVLGRSEFLLPPDEATQELYGRLLGPL